VPESHCWRGGEGGSGALFSSSLAVIERQRRRSVFFCFTVFRIFLMMFWGFPRLHFLHRFSRS
jgi:hypothetical protein